MSFNNQSFIQASYQRAAASAVTATQAVRSTTSGTMAPATTNLRAVPFDGISLNSATTGQPVYISAHGPLDPAAFNLGDGYACAVGTTAAGFPVRATDPTCVSAPNWLGHCDAHGNITIAPRTEQAFIVEDFGLIADGTFTPTPGPTPNDTLIEYLRVALNNSPCNVVQFGSGIYRFNETIGGLGVDAFPFGTIFQGQGVSDGFRPDPLGGSVLSAATGTVLAFYGPGVGLHIGYVNDANYGNNGAIRDLEIRGCLTAGVDDYPDINEIGIQILTDTSMTVERVRVTGFKYGISLDGAETTWLRDISFDGVGGQFGYQDMLTNLGDDSACAIRCGSFLCVTGGATNGIYIQNVQFNNSFYGIWHKDGVNHAVSNCNYEIPGGWALIHGVNNLRYENCLGENAQVASFHGRREAGPSTCFNVVIENCFFDGSAPAIKLENVGIGHLVLIANEFGNFGAQEIIEGGNFVSGPVLCEANSLPSTGPSAGQLSTTTYSMVGIKGTGVNHFRRVNAALDIGIQDYSAPSVRINSLAGTEVFSDESHTVAFGGIHSKLRQVYNPNTGLIGGYRSEHLECINLAALGDGYLGHAPSPGRGGGTVTVYVEGVSEIDRTKKGTWQIRQHWKDDGSGPSLIGSPTTVLADTTDTFTAPVIMISSNKFIAYVVGHASVASDWSAEVVLRHAGA